METTAARICMHSALQQSALAEMQCTTKAMVATGEGETVYYRVKFDKIVGTGGLILAKRFLN